MKPNPLAQALLLLLAVAVGLPAQQAATNQPASEGFDQLMAKAKSGDASAQYRLGIAYFLGERLPQDNAEAAKWFRKAADQGNADAQNRLGALYLGGAGVPEDHAEAAKLYRKAAEHGDDISQSILGSLYDEGDGVRQNYAEAVKWYLKAAKQGEVVAQNNLGKMYEDGRGVAKDDIEAYKWYNLAAAQGYKTATHDRDNISGAMTPSQIAEGQRLSREFVARKEGGVSNRADGPNSATTRAAPRFTGTGFFITDDGYLISNYHVVKQAVTVRLLTGAGLIDAKVVKVDAANDLALLKAAGRFAPLPVAASRGVKLGGTVATVGFPDTGLQGFSPKLAKGEIASLAGSQDDPRYFQISVPLQPGNSGGALVDAHGNVVGIVAAKLSAQAALDATGALPENVNYAVKSSFLLSFLESVPDVSAKLKEPNAQDEKFENVVKSAQEAAVLVLVY